MFRNVMRTMDRINKPVITENERALSAESIQSLRAYRRARYARPLPCQPRPV